MELDQFCGLGATVCSKGNGRAQLNGSEVGREGYDGPQTSDEGTIETMLNSVSAIIDDFVCVCAGSFALEPRSQSPDAKQREKCTKLGNQMRCNSLLRQRNTTRLCL